MDYLMGIDLGSTSLKAIVYDLDGRKVAGGSRPTQRFHPDPEHPDWTVWQPEQIWGGTADAIREAVGQLDDPTQIRAVAVTGMGMDGLPIDEQGQWLYPMISWHDPRTAPQHQWWHRHDRSGEDSFRSAATRSGPSTPPCGSCGWPSTSRRSTGALTNGC